MHHSLATGINLSAAVLGRGSLAESAHVVFGVYALLLVSSVIMQALSGGSESALVDLARRMGADGDTRVVRRARFRARAALR